MDKKRTRYTRQRYTSKGARKDTPGGDIPKKDKLYPAEIHQVEVYLKGVRKEMSVSAPNICAF